MDFHKTILPIHISSIALDEIKNIIETKNIPPGYGLRVGIKGSGCSGQGYVIGFDKPGVQDNQYSYEGITVFIEKKHLLYVAGLQIDFESDSESRGFTCSMPDPA
ncbi:MAG: iron-sulfur cluster assembly accessory protein [Cytophagaceae bacterium]|jgi:iron-sulfur cluster assembly protein|nr:iron-sulfur cluster assembly accessory protein [Cytophagaceae bacterium]